ncbi:ribose 5-phosphate isomerase A [Deinococcus soli (ex Cha et al. 2016)]|jgi:ribose 5-phosphate isomerase A|uniref:Ribose-5-phosphate isomerase A n=2 Tax=Deinococcus soli (ex Cha et al. 2016) TaxID=1309411 RepID=A0AAE4BLX4_9DEIO|nr:ribose 5-phosphate isomerase A [Deinococcus soli (ex Cha et al. 2016)]MDR6217176.1 ribose 5-phosphate isomerase A [Deinococcus soli (ex Cha et al. 2016)]MDR6326485.1 ribose 5-phosphate isomerase A [Deinococcus soli (ex Cha et al. 2016)]MDR6750788.1 ribose 5-phosphate isomerase A [Deinococcus soli (ex Cha et al. 2016)]
MDLEALKREAALRAVALVKSGDRVGLGTGSTAKYAIEEIGRKLAAGELTGVVGVATSEASDTLARQVGIPVEPLDPRPLDIAIDGADEIAPNLDLIKGLGGALLREKLTEVQARRFIVIADHTKLVEHIGEKSALPIEIARFGFLSTIERLRAILPSGRLRQLGAQPYVTDNGNYIFDAQIPAGTDIAALERQLKGTLGVVDTGLFLGMAERAFVAAPDGVTELTPR